jgi:UPF0716 protein FxsA
MPLVFAFFILMPILELMLLIKVGSYIGVFPTIAIVLVTAVLGVSLLRREGMSTIGKAQQRLEAGEMPASELVEGALLVVSGAFLLTPGFITDSIGFACLVPALRQRMAGYLIQRMSLKAVSSAAIFDTHEPPRANPYRPGFGDSNVEGEIIEGEVIEIDGEVVDRERSKDDSFKGPTRRQD